MIILRIYSILVMLLILHATASSSSIENHEKMILGMMYIPVLVYLINGGN